LLRLFLQLDSASAHLAKTILKFLKKKCDFLLTVKMSCMLLILQIRFLGDPFYFYTVNFFLFTVIVPVTPKETVRKGGIKPGTGGPYIPPLLWAVMCELSRNHLCCNFSFCLDLKAAALKIIGDI
jgi:hypothetical protein